MKIIDGITLLQMIKDGEVKSNTEIKVWFDDDGMREFITTLYFNGIDLKWQPETFYVRYFYNKHTEFEIIEDKEYEDIEEINILTDDINMNYVANNEYVKLSYSSIDLLFADKINTLIRNQKYILGVLNDRNK